MFTEVRKNIKGKTLKSRLTRIINKLCTKTNTTSIADMEIDDDGTSTNTESQKE